MSNIHAILKPFMPKKSQYPGADSSASRLLNASIPDFSDRHPAPLTPEALNHLINSTGAFSCPVILCIGTDRIIGDSLGPLVGSILKKRCTGLQNSCSTLQHPDHTLNVCGTLHHPALALNVYGTLHHPAHALNLPDINAEIKKKHPNSPVIAVDASLGSYKHIGSVFVRPGSIAPGSGVQKNLPPSGDIAITGIVNEESSHPYLALQTARLSTVADMAERIADCLLEVLLQTF